MSTIANASAACSGLSQSGNGMPSVTIFTFLVTAARIDDQTTISGCMQKGVLWCSLSMIPSNPSSSTSLYSSSRS